MTDHVEHASSTEVRYDATSIAMSVILYLLAFAFGTYLMGSGMVDTGQLLTEALSTFYLFAAQDRLPALASVGLIALAWLGRAHVPARVRRPGRLALPIVFVAAFGSAYLARVWASHSYDLSLDEFLPVFQAKIFLSGAIMAPLDASGLTASSALQPFFTYVNAEHGLWASYYRPVHAAIVALFAAGSSIDLVNPAMALISVVAIADIARRAFPDCAEAPLLAAALLAVSPQFVLMSGSGFSYPAHLAFNLVWLAAFLRGSMRAHIVAALVGFFAIGLHQVHIHPLFAAPFLAAMLFGAFGPRTRLIPYIVSYGLALPIWMMWPELAVWLQTGDTGVLPRTVMEIDYIRNYLEYSEVVDQFDAGRENLFAAVNLSRFLLWISPALLPLTFVSLRLARRIGLVPVLSGLSFVLMVLATHVLMPNQMQTWGARYYHPVLGNLVLFALGGYVLLRREGGGDGAAARSVTLTLIVASALILVPWRMIQVEAKMGPRAAVQQALTELDADVVLIDADTIWFGYDFIRNDPDLGNRPLIATVRGADRVGGYGPDQVTLDRGGLSALGLPAETLYEPGRP